MSSHPTHYQKTVFLLSVARVSQLPPDEGIEIAMVGRSNAGKSSVLNRVTQSKRLARVSKTPGRTQMVNIFVIDEKKRLIDLPGYGFAKVPLTAKLNWQKLVDGYIQTRASLKGLVLVMDIRHPMQALDKQLLVYCDQKKLPVHILLNKADKLSKTACSKTMHEVEQLLAGYHHEMSLQLFSATKNQGIETLWGVLDKWYGYMV